VEIHALLVSEAVLVPDMAVLRSGEKNTVFVALEGGKFEPREITLGARSGEGNYQVLSGLKPGETVVTSAQFLLDSESQLREAIQKMLRPQAASGEHAAQTPQAASSENSAHKEKAPPQTAYVCPMPEHVSILYGAPGKCPICRMTLVETTVTPSPSPTPSSSSILLKNRLGS
jgi:hypothetical protein